MTIKHGFFASSDPEDPITYDQPTYARVRAIDRPDGITDGLHDNFATGPADPAAMSVVVGGGHISIQGYWMESDADETLTIAAANADNPRIDRIVVRLDTITNLKVSLEVLTGTPASSPEVPALTQTASVYEIELAQIAVGAGVTSIVADNITDEREYRDELNLHHSPVLFKQASSGLISRLQFDNDGSMWFANNATYDSDADTWSQPDTSKPSTATKLGSDGVAVLLSCAAGNASITWVGASVTLSDVTINADKDWNQKSLSNVNKIAMNFMRAATGDTSRKNLTNRVSTTSDTYTLVKSITVPNGYVPAAFDTKKNKSSTFKVTFNVYSSGGGYSYGKVYVNGIARGTEIYTTTLSAPGVTKTENISGIYGGDTIELWMRNHTKSIPSDAAVNTTFQVLSTDSVVSVEVGADSSPTW